MFMINIGNLKKLKYHTFLKKQVFLLFTVSVVINIKNISKRGINWNVKNSWFN